MPSQLKHCKVAILAVDGFEESELTGPLRALTEAGADVDVISQKSGEIQGYRHLDKGSTVKVDRTFAQAKADDYDGVVLPGGVINSDTIRMIPEARDFVRSANAAYKPIAAICHGGWLPVSAGIVGGRTMTSWPSLQDDIRNAGGTWVDQRVVRDGHFVTSRKPDDLPAFNAEFIACLMSSAPL